MFARLKPLRAWLTVAALFGAFATAGPAVAKGPEISFWAVMGSVKDRDMYKALADRFQRETGISVKITDLSWGNFLTKYFTAMAAGLPPDIGVTNLGGPMDYGSVGGLVDLEAEFPKEIAELKNRFYPKLLPMFTFKGRLYGLPTDVTTLLGYYRTDIFERLGLKPPKTWSELEETIRGLEASGYHYYFGWTAGSQWSISLYTMPYGLPGFALDAAGRPYVQWMDPNYLKGVDYALRLWHTHDAPGQDMGSRMIGMFRSDDRSVAVPMIVDLPTYYSVIPITAPELKGRWDIFPWPKADDGAAHNVIGGTAYVIFRQSKHKREAFKWLQFLNTLDAQRFMILSKLNRGDESNFMISPVRAVWGPGNDPFWQRPELQTSRRIHEALTQVMDTFSTVPEIHGSVEAGRLESGVLDRMQSYIVDSLSSMAGKHGISRWELVQRFARGQYADEKADFDRRIYAKLKEEYGAVTPDAQRILEQETKSYDQRFGNVIAELPHYEKARDALFTIKWVAFGALLLAAALVFLMRRLRRHAVSYIFIAAPVVASVVFVAVPAVTALYLSFTQYHPVLPLSSAQWVGAANYAEVAHSGDLVKSIWRTVIYVVLTLPVGIAASLVLASLLNNKLFGQRYWRFVYFSPMVTSVVSISLIFTQLYLGSKQGWMNALLLKLDLMRDPLQFLHSEKTFLYCVILLAIWSGLAFSILIFLAGLQQIPNALYEAAEVDGASPARRFFSISLPGLRPQILFVAVLGLIGGFQVFEPIYMLGGGAGEAGAKFGPNDSGMTMVPLIYHTGFETFEMGKSTAIAYILFAIIFIFTIVQLRLFRERGGSS
jgi:multiple sugar transport system permease protein